MWIHAIVYNSFRYFNFRKLYNYIYIFYLWGMWPSACRLFHAIETCCWFVITRRTTVKNLLKLCWLVMWQITTHVTVKQTFWKDLGVSWFNAPNIPTLAWENWEKQRYISKIIRWTHRNSIQKGSEYGLNIKSYYYIDLLGQKKEIQIKLHNICGTFLLR